MEQLEKLLRKGVKLSIESGRWVIDGQLTPYQQDWLDRRKQSFIQAVVKKRQGNVFTYSGYTTGRYDKQNYPGITLSFINLLTGECYFVIFNACLDRKRTTKHGQKDTALPKGHFAVGKRSLFYKFWFKTGLDIPRRLSSFHDYMGKLKGLLFEFDIMEKEKLDKVSAAMLSITNDELKKLIITDNIPTTLGQDTDNSQTKSSDKVIKLAHSVKDFQAERTTGQINYGLSYQGSTDIRDSISLVNNTIPISNQSNEEWLNDYRNG